MIGKIILTLLLLSSLLKAELFEQENLNVDVVIGGGTMTTTEDGTQSYAIVGLNADYFIVNNLAVGLGYMGWFGASPTLNQLTIPITYYVPLGAKFRPYFGAFLRETFVSDGYDDYESYGGKVGVAITLSRNSYMGIGWIQEYHSSCGDWQDECSSSYPEFVFALSF